MLGLDILIENWQILLKALGYSLLVSLFSFILGFALASLFTVVRLFSSFKVPKWAVRAYVETFRGTPMMVQLFFIYYASPAIGINLSPFQASVIAFALNSAAYQSEYLRAGLMSVPKTQYEAAESLGLSKWGAVFSVVLPVGLRASLSSLGNEFVALFKYSSIASFVTLPELFYVARYIAAGSFRYLEMYTVLAIIYVVIGFALSKTFRKVERFFYVPGLMD
ncbi:MAG TPA: amino acid ABC transporter permease [Fervidicoccus fontis]|uniref:Amino acid ABC transporter permease n=1 Tax=Fervidicoccus fontis TaxID=683846 RepID=A0A7C2Z3J9_9CREN|nr:MAG: amino acid ABC transporter permease [Fervidicoccus sp.]HEU97421.1 amino acid ABC transporter permease [Fervidicoccus fontis]